MRLHLDATRMRLYLPALHDISTSPGLTGQHRDFQLLQEQALAANSRERAIENDVAARRQRHQLDRKSGMRRAQSCGDVFGLPERERALARGDAQDSGHAGFLRDA